MASVNPIPSVRRRNLRWLWSFYPLTWQRVEYVPAADSRKYRLKTVLIVRCHTLLKKTVIAIPSNREKQSHPSFKFIIGARTKGWLRSLYSLAMTNNSVCKAADNNKSHSNIMSFVRCQPFPGLKHQSDPSADGEAISSTYNINKCARNMTQKGWLRSFYSLAMTMSRD